MWKLIFNLSPYNPRYGRKIKRKPVDVRFVTLLSKIQWYSPSKTYLAKFCSLHHVNIFSHLLLSYDKQEAVGCHKNGVWNSCTLCKYNKTTATEQPAIQAAAFPTTWKQDTPMNKLTVVSILWVTILNGKRSNKAVGLTQTSASSIFPSHSAI